MTLQDDPPTLEIHCPKCGTLNTAYSWNLFPCVKCHRKMRALKPEEIARHQARYERGVRMQKTGENIVEFGKAVTSIGVALFILAILFFLFFAH